jgi:DNA-binding response OmpR family regulator
MQFNGTATTNSKRRILVVDHDARIVDEIALELRKRETFEIQTLTSGNAARAAVHSKTFDLVIVERNLPEVDGVTLIHEAQEHSPHTVTVLMTALGFNERPLNETHHIII